MSAPLDATSFFVDNYLDGGTASPAYVVFHWTAPAPTDERPRVDWRFYWSDDLQSPLATVSDSSGSGDMSYTCKLNRSIVNSEVRFVIKAHQATTGYMSDGVYSQLVHGPLTAPSIKSVSRSWNATDIISVAWKDNCGKAAYSHSLQLTLSVGDVTYATLIPVGDTKAGIANVGLPSTGHASVFLNNDAKASLQAVPTARLSNAATQSSAKVSTQVKRSIAGITTGHVESKAIQGKGSCLIYFTGNGADAYQLSFSDPAKKTFYISGQYTDYGPSVYPSLEFTWESPDPLYVTVTAMMNGYLSEPYTIPAPYTFTPHELTAPDPESVSCPSPDASPQTFEVTFSDAMYGTPKTFDDGTTSYQYVVLIDGKAAAVQSPESGTWTKTGERHTYTFELREPYKSEIGIEVMDSALDSDVSGTVLRTGFKAKGSALYSYGARVIVDDCDVTGTNVICWLYGSTVTLSKSKLTTIGDSALYYRVEGSAFCSESDGEYE